MHWYLLAQEVAEEEGGAGIGLLLPHLEELIGGIIAFAIVFVFMWRWAFPAIDRMLENRQKAISGSLEQAEERKHEAESLLQDYRQQLSDAREEANRIIEEARQTAESLRSDAREKAETEADDIVRRARDEVRTERERAVQELRSEMAALSIELAERVVGKEIDRDAQRDLVDSFLRELEDMQT